MSMKRKAKKFATLLNLMVSGAVLASCGKETTNEIASVYEIDDSGIIVFGHAEDCTDVYDEKKVKVTSELLEKIKEKVEEYNSSTLHIALEKTAIDFTDIELSSVTSLIIDCPNIDFNYVPFYANAYEYISVTISENTNKEDIINFLQNINFVANKYDEAKTSPWVNLDFTEEISSDLINEYLEAVSKIEGLSTFDIETSSNINEINLTDIKCSYLRILHNADKEIAYNITLNDSVKDFNLQTNYSENYKEDEILLKQFIVNSNNNELDIYYYVDGLAKIYNDTIITLPSNSVFELVNVNVDSVSDSWYQQFKNISRIRIRETNKSDYSHFCYNSSTETIDDAIAEMNFAILEDEVKTILEENGLDIRRYDEKLYLEADKPSDIVILDDKVYDYINSVIRKYNVTSLVIIELDKQIDFSKIDLSNITSTDLSSVGYNFDYTEFIKFDNEKNPINNLRIQVKKDNNHINRINYLKSIPLADNAFVGINIREDVDVETVTSYINALDLSKVEHLYISYDKINELDLTNINVPILDLIVDYNGNYKETIDYSININSKVKQITLSFYYDYDRDYELNPILSKVKINSSNNDLTTYLMVGAGVLDESLNCQVESDTSISVPNNSNLYITGVEENSITKDFLRQFNNLSEFIIKNNANDYRYEFNDGEWVYYYNENKKTDEEEVKKLLKEVSEYEN